MNFTFIGVPGEDHKELNMYGQTFPKGKSVKVDNKLAQVKLANHPHFKGGTESEELLVLPQSIPSVEKTYLVSDGIDSVTSAEVDAINADPRMLPGYQVSHEQVLKAKEDANGDNPRIGPEGSAKAGRSR